MTARQIGNALDAMPGDRLPPEDLPHRLLSIVSQGRNDSYMGNFTWRLSTVINKHARNLVMLGAEHDSEILITDWGSRQPLHQVLDLSDEARQLVRFLLVSPETAKIHDKDAGFSVPHALNCAGRRASGKYLLLADSDVYIPQESMARLLSGLRAGRIGDYPLDETFFWASKRHIPNTLVQQEPTLEQIDKHIEHHWTSYVREQVSLENFLGCGVAMLQTREMWHQSRGHDERLIYWGWNDIDWHRRLVTRYRWDDLERLGMKMFHLEHYADRFGSGLDELKKINRKSNPQTDPAEFAPNPDDWGLGQDELVLVDGHGHPVECVIG